MLPNVYEFAWEGHRIVFVGFFLLVAATLVATLVVAAVRTWNDSRRGRAALRRWHEDFASLPTDRRLCIHASAGEASPRVCDRAFACDGCSHAPTGDGDISWDVVRVHGLEIHPDRAYHPGHTWVRRAPDGTARVGLDPLATRLLPPEFRVVVPHPGTELRPGDTAFEVPDETLRVLTPVAGRVRGREIDDGWPVLVLEDVEDVDQRRDFLRGRAAAVWMERELRRLQSSILGPASAQAWADGGDLVDDLPRAAPRADWTAIRQEMFLDV